MDSSKKSTATKRRKMVEDHGSDEESNGKKATSAATTNVIYVFVSFTALPIKCIHEQRNFAVILQSPPALKVRSSRNTIIRRLCFFRARTIVIALHYTTLTPMINSIIIWCSTGKRIVILLSWAAWYQGAVVSSLNEKYVSSDWFHYY